MKKRNPSEKSKFLSYFDLRDAFQEPGCAICTLIERCSFNYLDALLYEQVNDVGTRIRLRQSLGFCNWHAWRALEVSNCALGLGIIYEDILRRIEERLAEVQSSFPARFPWFGKLFRREKYASQPSSAGDKQPCPVCQHNQLFENLYLKILLDYIGEEDFERQFSHSAGICFPHLVKSMEEYPSHRNLLLLIGKQMKKFEFLRNEVKEFIRKQDYQYAEEPRGPEINSWKRALEMAVGKRGIFPGATNGGRRAELHPLDHSPSDQPKDSPAKETKEGLPDAPEEWKSENESFRRQASSLRQIAWKMAEDNRTLKADLTDANAEVQRLLESVERLNKEVERLKELLKRHGQLDKVRDKIE